jgi:hypothetical protein
MSLRLRLSSWQAPARTRGRRLSARNLENLLLLHWNGTTWSEAPGPLDRAVETIPGVSDAAPGNAWIVGNRGIRHTTAVATLTLHWNGTIWRHVPSPSPGQSNELRAVAIVSASDVWAVGEHGTSTGGQAALTVHWNGASWVRVPNPGGTSDSSPGSAWCRPPTAGPWGETSTRAQA